MKTVLLKWVLSNWWLQSFSRFFSLYSSDCKLELHTGSRNWRACQALCPQIWGLKPQWSSRPCASSTSSGRWASLPLSLFFVHAQRNHFLQTIHAHTLWRVCRWHSQNKLLSDSCWFHLLAFSIFFVSCMFPQYLPEAWDTVMKQMILDGRNKV